MSKILCINIIFTVGQVNLFIVHRFVKSKTATSAYSLRPKRNRTSICGENDLCLKHKCQPCVIIVVHLMLRNCNFVVLLGFQTALTDHLLSFWFKTVSSPSVKFSRQHMSCESNNFIVDLTRWFLHSSYPGWTEDDRELSQRIQAPAVFWSCECHCTHFHRLNTHPTGKMAIIYIQFVYSQKFDKEPHFSLLKELFIQVSDKSEQHLPWKHFRSSSR